MENRWTKKRFSHIFTFSLVHFSISLYFTHNQSYGPTASGYVVTTERVGGREEGLGTLRARLAICSEIPYETDTFETFFKLLCCLFSLVGFPICPKYKIHRKGIIYFFSHLALYEYISILLYVSFSNIKGPKTTSHFHLYL